VKGTFLSSSALSSTSALRFFVLGVGLAPPV
jgi:hypothetical protein